LQAEQGRIDKARGFWHSDFLLKIRLLFDTNFDKKQVFSVWKELSKKPFPLRCRTQNAQGPLALYKRSLMVNTVLGRGHFVTTDQLNDIEFESNATWTTVFVNLYSIQSFGLGPGTSVVARLLCDRGRKYFAILPTKLQICEVVKNRGKREEGSNTSRIFANVNFLHLRRQCRLYYLAEPQKLWWYLSYLSLHSPKRVTSLRCPSPRHSTMAT